MLFAAKQTKESNDHAAKSVNVLEVYKETMKKMDALLKRQRELTAEMNELCKQQKTVLTPGDGRS